MTAPMAAAPAVRVASMRDIPALVALMRDFHAEAGWRLDEALAAEAFGRLVAHPSRGGAWLAFDGGQAVGHIVLSLRWTLDHGGLAGHVDDLYVRQSHRGRRIGSALLDALLAQAAAIGCRSLQVEVGASNPAARALYTRRGLGPPGDDRLLLGCALGDAPPLSAPELALQRASPR